MNASEHLGRAKIWAISCGLIGSIIFAFLIHQINHESALTVVGGIVGLVMGYTGGILLYTGGALCTWVARKLS